MDYGKFIKARREELNLSQQDVADACGVSRAAVCRWETGEINDMKRSRIAALASILKVKPSVFIGGEVETVDITADQQKLLTCAKDATADEIRAAIALLNTMKGMRK